MASPTTPLPAAGTAANAATAAGTAANVASPATAPDTASPARALLRRRRAWKPAEFLFWGAALLAPLALPRSMLLMNEIAILGLFALSLDLILGYAGIVSLGHAAFLGVGAYAAGLFALNVSADPLAGLVVAMLAASVLGFLTSFLVLRGTDLTRLMVTLGVALLLFEAANSWRSLTGGADGLQGIAMDPVLGLFDFDLKGRTAYFYSLAVLFLLFLAARRMMGSPFGLSLRALRDNRLRASASGVGVNGRLVLVYTLAAAYAGAAGGLLAQTTQFVSLDVLEFHRSADLMLVLIIGGTGWLYGGLIGAVLFELFQDVVSAATPQYWQFWVGLLLVVFVSGGREAVHKAGAALRQRVAALFGGRRP
ncbi:branched-chain amino acid ABC transporter permease [Ancylobacter sp. Lp-2]|uniref:branched-chain amino acid ABC transporter permease n=1 Tax=Ancylobacter sp. Lp-2 TaxID=2881339 RepID=UPI001E614EE1|nr:branched-chain amino acid ABC transporter permease [Ancylobacter sp. Lp-2]MCB4769747.1 branched-chain amino acid ABC transporter permease [Ancylobacter sp. Lp-2]